MLDLHQSGNEKPELDIEIEEINKYRKLPFPLEESERNFYYPFRSVGLNFLEDVYKKYLSNLDTQDREDSGNESQDDFDEYNHSQNNDSLETYNEEDEDLKLSKRTSEMMPEELPSLKKEKSNKSKSKVVGGLQMINENEDKVDEIKFFMIGGKGNAKEKIRTKSISSKKSKNSRAKEDLEDFDLPELSLK